MAKKPTGLEEWMRDRDRHPPDEKAREKALDEWVAFQTKLEQMTPAEREWHEREMKEGRRRRKTDDEGYGLELPDGTTRTKQDDDDSDSER